MAEEVGSAYVSLIPSARGFSKKAKAELTAAMRGVKEDDTVKVPVKPEIDPVSGTLRAELQTQMRAIARRIALEVPVGADTDGLRAKLQSQLDGIRSTLAMEVPTEPGETERYRRSLRGMLDRIRANEKQHIDVDTDVDKDNRLLGRMGDTGSHMANALLGRFGEALLNPMIGIPALILAAVTVTALAPVLAGMVLAGGGLAGILVGAFALRADEDLKKAMTGLGQSISTTLADAAKPLKGPFLEAIGIIAGAIKDMGPDLKDFFKDIAPSIPKLAQGFGGFLKQLTETGALDKFGKAIGPVLDQLAMALPDIGNALAQFMISMAEVGPEGAAGFGAALRTVADIIRFLGDTIVWLVERGRDLAAIWDWLKERVKDLGAGILTAVLALGGFGPAVDTVKMAIKDAAEWIAEKWRALWDGMSTKVSSTVDSATTFVKDLPGKVKTAVGDLGTLLFDAGKNVVQGLINGIKDKLGALAGMASQMAGTIAKYLPHSPAEEGPLSGSGSPFDSGQSIAAGIASGVQSQLPTVASAADELAGMFGTSGPGARGGASMASMRPTLLVDGSGLPDALAEWLRHNVRIVGPDGTVEGAYAAA